jgi:class 3 adenylate cyclase
MSRTRSVSANRQQLPRQGQLYAIRVLFTLLALAMLALSDTLCRSQPGHHLWLLLLGATYPHLAHLLLGRFRGVRRGQAILIADGFFAGSVIGAIGLLSAPSVVLAAISLFNWTILGGATLVAMGMIAALAGIASTGTQVLTPIATGECATLDALAAFVLLGYFFVIARFMFRYIGELRQQQAELQAAADTADGARAIADRTLLGVLPASAADILAERGDLPPCAVSNATLLLVEFAWPRGESPAVTELAECFRICDAILKRHGFEGIKTFGRRFLAMSRAETGPDDAIKAARELNDYLLDHAALVTLPAAQRSIRAFLHCGAVTAGLVQPERLNYDLLGETVEALLSLANLAAAHPVATVIASSAVRRRLHDATGFAIAPGEAGAELSVLNLVASP